MDSLNEKSRGLQALLMVLEELREHVDGKKLSWSELATVLGVHRSRLSYLRHRASEGDPELLLVASRMLDTHKLQRTSPPGERPRTFFTPAPKVIQS